MCCNIIKKAIKKITHFRKKHPYYMILVECEKANMEFEMRNIPLDGELPDVNMPRGKSWGCRPESDEDLALSLLIQILA